MAIQPIFWIVVAILAILVGLLSYSYAKNKGKTGPQKWFIVGFSATVLAAIAYYFFNKKK